MKKKTVKIGLLQMRMSTDLQANMKHALALAEKAAKKGAKILCLPELYRSHYFPQAKKANKDVYAETIPGPSSRAFAKIAEEYGVAIIVPIYEKDRRGKYHNAALVIDETGRLLPTYRKVHIPHDPLFYEKNYFEEGAEYRVYRTRSLTFAVLICYDQWFPEAARSAALQGADLIFYPTAIGRLVPRREPDDDWAEAWETVMRGHGIANAVHIAAVNRVGREKKLDFWGRSFIADSFGNVLRRASEKKEEVLVQTLDLRRNTVIREGWRFFHNRRPDTYGALHKRRV